VACVIELSVELLATARIYMWTSHRIEREKFDVRLFCRADGDPQPTVTWLGRNGVALKNNSAS